MRNNTSTHNNIGIWVGAGNDRVLVRNNVSYLNDGSTTQDYPEGLRVNGDTNPNTPKPPSNDVTVVHNTLYKNGNNNSNSFNSAAITQDPQFVDAAGADFHLRAGSACVDHGAFLTTATAAGNNSNTLTVGDARYFTDGYGLTSGDSIMIGSQTATIVRVSGNTLTLDRNLTWAAGASVSYPYLGAAPDIGAVESH